MVVGPRRAWDATFLHQAGDPDGEVCPRRTQEKLNGRIWAILAATVALAAALRVGLEACVAKMPRQALVWTASEVHWGQGQRRGRDPPAERAVDDGVLSQTHHRARSALRLGRGKGHVSQRETSVTFNFAGLPRFSEATLPAKAHAHESYDTQRVYPVGHW